MGHVLTVMVVIKCISLFLFFFSDVALGSGFSQLSNLTELLFAKGKFRCARLADKMFENLENSSLQYLDLSGVGFINIQGQWNFPHLETLKLNHNHFLDNGMPSIFIHHGILKMPNLKHLYMQNVLLASYEFNRLVKYLYGSKLKLLEVDQNYITKMLVFIPKARPKFGKNFFGWKSTAIKHGTAFGYLISNAFKARKSQWDKNQIYSYQSPQRYRRSERTGYYEMGAEQPFICFNEPNRSCPLKIPENLTSLDLSSSAFPSPVIPGLILFNNNTLRLVNLSFNAIQHLPKPFYCAYSSKSAVNVLDLSNNKIKCITSSFFSHCNWSSLNILNVNQNQLKQSNLGYCSGNGTEPLSFIKPLLNLTKLDLSGNEFDRELNPKNF